MSNSAMSWPKRGSCRRLVSGLICVILAISASGTWASPRYHPAASTSETTQPQDAVQVRDFVWVGNRPRQFSDAQFRDLSANYDLVVIAAFHCRGVRECHNDAARRLKRLNPDMKVLAYMNALLSELEGANANELYGKETFDNDWLVRDERTGRLITVGDDQGGIMDLSNPDARSWMLEQIEGWMSAAPFDGVGFDRVQGAREPARVLRNRVGRDKILAMAEGELALVREVKEALGPEKIVVYNGLKDWRSTPDGRIYTAPLEWADGAANEYFCYHKQFGFVDRNGFDLEKSVIREVDAQLRAAERGKIVLDHVSYQDDALTEAQKSKISRMCYGAFLLGHRPGYTSYKFGFLTTHRVLEESTAEKSIELGNPVGSYSSEGNGIYTREFDNGIVVVNLGDSEQRFALPFAGIEMNGGRRGRSFSANQTARVPGRDALFLLRQ